MTSLRGRPVTMAIVVAAVVAGLLVRGALGAITGGSVTPQSLVAGAATAVDVACTLGLPVAVGGSLVVVFPPAFYVAGPTLSNAVGLDAQSPVIVAANGYVVTISVAATAVGPGSVSFTLGGVTNPGAGPSAPFTIRTQDANGNTVESSSSVAGSTLVASALTAAAVTLAPATAGAAAQLTVTLTTDVLLRVGSRLELELPVLPSSKFVVSGATVAARVNVPADSTSLSTALPFLRLTIAGQDIAPGTALAVTFGGLFNPAAQLLGTFSVRTRHSAGTILQEATGVTGPGAITATALAPATTAIAPVSSLAGMVTSYVVSFANAAYLPAGATITVDFPARFGLSGAGLASVANMPTTNAVLAAVGPTSLRLILGAGPVLAGSARGFTIANVVNPGTSCDQYILEYCTPAWEPYALVLADAAGNVYEQSAAVPGTPILKKPLVFARVRPLLPLPVTPTAVVVALDTQAAVPLGGGLEVVFPAGYGVDPATAAASGHVGLSPLSTALAVTGQQMTLTVAGAAIPPTTGLSVTLSGLTTPVAEATGMYIVRTRDAQGRVLEEHPQVNGEGCLYLNSCNGHGTCTLFSETCVCNPGWGAPSDIATYRAPDCTTRVCPAGPSWGSPPLDAHVAHDRLEECSGMGLCDRSTGRCLCFPGFGGSACQRMTCPNNCSGRGRCVSLAEMATLPNALPLSPVVAYGGAEATTTWDQARIFGCVCDSAWSVGPGPGELQVAEYFGGDCSKRHCPTGDDPETPVDETDCSGVVAPGGFVAGDPGNRCHVECANRGICNYKTGSCQCFAGFKGFACQVRDQFTK